MGVHMEKNMAEKAFKLKVLNGAVAEFGDSFVLRGVVDMSTYYDIKVDMYQREEGSISELAELVAAFEAGNEIPDIEIGVRGGNYSLREGVHYVRDECYIIDGLQRLTAAKRAMAQRPELSISLGAKLHFNTTYKWEKDRFKLLNQKRRKVSPNVLLRNDADEAPSIGAIYAMSQNDKEFVLRGRVSWGQKMTRNELVTALSLLKTVGSLHSHFGPGLTSNTDQLMKASNKTMENVGPNIWRANIRTFFLVLDQAFGVKLIAFRDLSPWVKIGFLRTMATVLAEHKTFWEGTRLDVPRGFTDKLKKFPIAAPEIAALIQSSSGVNPILYSRLVAHLDSGKRTGRMVKWSGMDADGVLSMETLRATNDHVPAEEFADSEACAAT